MSKSVLIATEKPFSAEARDQVVSVFKQANYTVKLLEKYDGKAPLLEAIADADAVIVRSDDINAEVLAAAKNLKLVVRAGAGYDNIDCATAKQRGIAVMNTPGQNANAVAELVLSMMVYVARGQFNGKPGTELRGKTLGIHAFGAVGRAVSTIAQGFGMQVIAFDPFVEASVIQQAGVDVVSNVEELYKRSRYLSLHIPKTEKTKNSIGKSLLSLMPKGATLINTARKEVINESELLEVFAARPDFKYVTDILPSDTVVASLKEKYADRFYGTPNKMGAQTAEANTNAGIAAANQIVGFFERSERKFIVNS